MDNIKRASQIAKLTQKIAGWLKERDESEKEAGKRLPFTQDHVYQDVTVRGFNCYASIKMILDMFYYDCILDRMGDEYRIMNSIGD